MALRVPMPSSVPRLTGVGLVGVSAVATVLGVIGDTETWVGVYGETHRAMGESLLFGLPAAVACGAWVGSRARVTGLDGLAEHSVRPPVRIAVRELAMACAYVVMGFVVVTTAMLVVTAREARHGSVSPTWWAADVAALVAATALGLWAGHKTRRSYVVPAAAVVTYVALGFMVYVAPEVLSSLLPIDGRAYTTHSVPWWLHALRAGFLVLVAASVVYVRGGLHRVAVATAWVAGLVAAPLLFLGSTDRQVDAAASRLVCEGAREGVRVCAPPPKMHVVDDLAAEYLRVQEVVGPLLPTPVLIIDDEAAWSSESAAAAVAEASAAGERDGLTVLRLSDVGDISAYAQVDRKGFAVSLIYVAVPPQGDSAPSPDQAIQRWAYQALGLPTDGTAAPGAPRLDAPAVDFSSVAGQVAWWESLDRTRRTAWLQEHRIDIAAGDLAWTDFR